LNRELGPRPVKVTKSSQQWEIKAGAKKETEDITGVLGKGR